MQQFTVEANLREDRGKNAARRIRRTGLVPATLYGGKGGAVAVTVNAKQVVSILKSETGHNTIFTLKLAGSGDDKVIVKDWQADPVRGDLLHVDLLRIAMDVRMRVKVPVHTFGEPQGVKLQGGIFEMVTREVEVECLPADIPEEFRMDVSSLMIHMQLRAGDLKMDGEKVKLVTDPQRVLAHVVTLRVEEEVKPAEAVAAEAAAPAEPEVIKKGKKEVEEGEEGEAEPAKAEKPEKSEKKK
ncbi:MAG: 50S ribosomal protein L25 [Acidobacteria bacterium]|nr:50S ribosomal protein L25 [Acidobacteriota bacterium]MCL5287067.1 50S ribosomal protein L25 [Acidobacteriota bacterium]